MNEPMMIRLYDYNVWATERVFDHLQSLPDELFTREASLGFSSIAELIRHLVAADEIWFARIKEEPALPPAPPAFATLLDARGYTTGVQTRIRAYLAAVPDAGRIVAYKFRSGEGVQHAIYDIVQQIVNHGTYHRGNLTTMLRTFGHGGVLTDYIAYLTVMQE